MGLGHRLAIRTIAFGWHGVEESPHVSAGSWMLRLFSLIFAGIVFPSPCLAGLETFTKLDQVGSWVIERKISASGQLQCRASIPSGGAWFGANIHLSAVGQLVIPEGRTYAGTPQDVVVVLEAMQRCRDDILYLP